MEFDHTDHEYLAECRDGCGPLTGWLMSRTVADQAVNNHHKEQGHQGLVRVRARQGLSD